MLVFLIACHFAYGILILHSCFGEQYANDDVVYPETRRSQVAEIKADGFQVFFY
jgi:hypothetical protein